MKVLFLDRDGVINVDHGYVYKAEDFEFIKDIFDLIRLFVDAGYLIFVLTNQSGIGRGYYTEEDLKQLTNWMKDKFRMHGIHIEAVYYCPHAPEENCYCRKPKIGMIDQALQSYNINLSDSWMIGDKQSDIDLAKNANIGKSIAIGTTNIKNADFFLQSVKECKHFLEINKDIINL